MKDYDKNKELSFLQYWDANNLYGQAILQKLPVNNFQISFQFNEDFIKNYNDESNERYLLMFNILKNYMNFIMIYYFYQKD